MCSGGVGRLKAQGLGSLVSARVRRTTIEVMRLAVCMIISGKTLLSRYLLQQKSLVCNNNSKLMHKSIKESLQYFNDN